MPKAEYVVFDGVKLKVVFKCPACGFVHGIATVDANDYTPGKIGPLWEFNGDLENPTIDPSILVTWPTPHKGEQKCHSFVKDGKIQFCSDSTHRLAGQTVELPEFTYKTDRE